MEDRKQHLEALAQFIRDNRSNEGNFEKLHQRLTEEIEGEESNNSTYITNLQEAMDKQAAAYRQMKDTDAGAWPEFEKFVTAFETSVTEALKEA